MEKAKEKDTSKVKFEKPVFYAQNMGSGSFAATCPPNVGKFNSVGGSYSCSEKCRNCATAI